MNPTTALYFESHITIDPVLEEEDLRVLNTIARLTSFRVAELLLRKGGQHTDDSFLTSRSTSYDEIQSNTSLMVRRLRHAGFVVRRYKIENTLVDSRMESDPLGVLA